MGGEAAQLSCYSSSFEYRAARMDSAMTFLTRELL